jgi:hypothetical protein
MAKNFASTTLKIRVTDWHTFKSSSQTLEYLQSDELEISNVNIFSGPGEDAIEAIARAASIILVYIMWACLIISPRHGISIIKVFQMADYLLYFNADTPTNLAAALIIFSATPLTYIPNPFEYFEATRGGTCSAPKKFEQNGVSCYILDNIGSYVLQLIIFFIIKIVSGILIKLSYRDLGEHSKTRRLSIFLHRMFNYEFIAGFLDGTQLDVYMSVYINFKVYKGDSLYSVVNLVICSTMGIGYLWMVITALYLSDRVQESRRAVKQKGYKEYYAGWAWMRDGLQSDSFFARHHMAIMYFKDPLLAGMLVFLHEVPHLQIGTIAVLNGILFFVYSWCMPFKDKLACWTEISNYAVFFVGASIFFT